MMRLASLLFHDVYVHDVGESGFAGATAARYKIAASGFDSHLAALDRILGTPPVLVGRVALTSRCRTPVALTFDDGGFSYHAIVADRLEARGWRGHCFVTTGRIGQRGFLGKQELRDLHARGHLIGSHSVSHPPRLTACTPQAVHREWLDSRKALEDILGDAVICASVPGGYYAKWIARAAATAGLQYLFTSEPDPAMHVVGGCRVFGRFTVRPGRSPDYVGHLAACYPAAVYRERIAWQAKKAAKKLLGNDYPRLGERLHRMRTRSGARLAERRQRPSS